MIKQTRITFSMLLLLSALILVIIGGTYAYNYYQLTNKIVKQTIKNAQEQTVSVAQKLDDIIVELIPIVQKIANKMSSQKLSYDEIIALIKQKPIELNGLGVGFLPYKFSSHKKLFAPYYVEKAGKQTLLNIEDMYDYTKPKYDWFYKPLEGEGFIEPYYGPASETIIIEYSAPFYDAGDTTKNKKPIGIVFANQSVKHLNYILLNLYAGTTSYWFITSQNGTIINHPRDRWVLKQKNINDIAAFTHNEKIIQFAQKAALENPSEPLVYYNEISGDKSWLFAAQMPTTKWTLFQVFDIREVPIDQNYKRQTSIIITTCLLAALLLLILFITMQFSYVLAYFWMVSAAISFLLALNIIIIWYFVHQYPHVEKVGQMIKNKQNLHQILEQKIKKYRLLQDGKSTKKHSNNILLPTEKNEKYVATGLFLSNFCFLKDGKVEIHGFIWQHYFDTIHAHLAHGFIFPQAIKLHTQKIVERKTKDGITIIWEISAVIDQLLDYKRFPFDAKTLDIEIWHKEFRKKITLIPDFDSYAPIIPRTLPGLGSEAEIRGWFVNKSYFSYKITNPNTFFGMYSYGPYGIYEFIDKSATPKLHFNITIQRCLTGILLGYIIPLFVIALLLFVILLTGSSQGGFVAFIQFSGLFFGTLIAQKQLRYKIPTESPVYFEWFYLLMNGIIIPA